MDNRQSSVGRTAVNEEDFLDISEAVPRHCKRWVPAGEKLPRVGDAYEGLQSHEPIIHVILT
jgi:hypothetical protein